MFEVLDLGTISLVMNIDSLVRLKLCVRVTKGRLLKDRLPNQPHRGRMGVRGGGVYPPQGQGEGRPEGFSNGAAILSDGGSLHLLCCPGLHMGNLGCQHYQVCPADGLLTCTSRLKKAAMADRLDVGPVAEDGFESPCCRGRLADGMEDRQGKS
ncbi:MAG: hypothetical protein FRX49_02274 [Trebouxia sp. A1-2]|nr:MAG: hypothetical protein FRX49_02274 [Trebouxia sp. A1-2]